MSTDEVIGQRCLVVAFFTLCQFFAFFFNRPSPPDIYTLSLHDALPIYVQIVAQPGGQADVPAPPEIRRAGGEVGRSEEHTSELQSRFDLVCRLLLEKKNNIANQPSMNRQNSLLMVPPRISAD